MGRLPQPTEVLEISGAGGKNPARLKDRENRAAAAVGKPIGAPPKEWKKPCSIMPGAREAIWRQYIANAPPGTFQASDWAFLKLLCETTYEADRPGKDQKAYRREMKELLKEMAGTPRRRGTLPVQKSGAPAKGGKLAEFQRKKAG